MTTTLTTPDGSAVPPYAFGTMQFGGRADEAQSRALFDACRAAGIRHFDTAWVYTEGRSETLLGRFAAAERDALFIATKVANTPGCGRAAIRSQFDTCRSRLGMDRIDLLYLHRFDPDTPLEETIGTLAELQDEGLVRHLGLSNSAAWQVMKAQAIATRLGTRIDVLQPMYNVVKRQAEVEILPMCASEGILPVPYSPLGGGLLTGKYAAGSSGRLTEDTMYARRYGAPEMHAAAAGLAEIARDVGIDPATLAVAWVARHAARPVPILSARSVEQVAPSLAAMGFDMDDALYARISALMPPPPPATDRSEEA
ncbi:aldo/keto reductase [Roseivivax isoporae]|uniref:Aldo/keto reductase n=1 Tax=Roseivivax isoporae LMG 25204 TaxID=1449351 RepID=X7F3Y6_9RHOB|nr:aldo/keto reductase [Roseivivax isoporae]ETX27607.1 aldo/keto reductase [Roseivivax isoporae LMG 25204]